MLSDDNALLTWKKIGFVVDSSVGIFYDRENIQGDVFLWFLCHPGYKPFRKVIRWRIIDCLRKIRIETSLGDIDPPSINMENLVEDNLEIKDRIDSLIQDIGLDSEGQELLYLRWVKGLTLEDIGFEMDISKGLVSKMLGSIMLRLKNSLSKEENDHEQKKNDPSMDIEE